MPAPDPGGSLARDFALAEAAVREAGALALAYFQGRPAAWSKADESPVSEADHAVDSLLHRRLARTRLDYGWISEETADAPARHGRERVWIVDPIDGTRAFLAGRPDWVVSLALVEAGVPVFGFLYSPVHGEFLAARRGAGATLNDRPIRCDDRPRIAGARMLASTSRLAASRWRQPWPQMELARVNSFAYRVALVATGRADATLAFLRIHEWDLVAADLVLAEAGGRMTDLQGAPFAYNSASLRRSGAIAAGPGLHAALVDFIARNWQDDEALPSQ